MKTAELLTLIGRDWARARPDLDATPMLTVILTQRSGLLLGQQLEAFFGQHGLTPSGFDVLATLRRSAPPAGLALSQLGALMAVTPPAVTKRVDALEAEGLVARTPAPGDRRATRVSLTVAGRTLVDRVLPLHVANEQRLLSALSPDEQTQLRALLLRLAEGLEAETE